MAKPLIIVESPAKAKTITRFLGKDFVVESSIGHIRDLPATADEIPEAFRKKPWARTGVDVENGFRPLYIVPPEKRAHVKKLKDLVRDASELYLATDEDREGEAIAWHLREVLAPRVPVRRMVFHEITEKAIRKALESPRAIDDRLVDAQEARRILDRLYGYEVSPVLWRKIAPRLSAGRVQSVATRLVVERERARLVFKSGKYASVVATFEAKAPPLVGSELLEVGGRRVARGADFDPKTGALSEAAKTANFLQLGTDEARAITRSLAPEGRAGLDAKVVDVQRKPFTQRPYPPFITSTLQMEAARKLRFGAQRTMRLAQRLYENGFITYMRTDSTTLSDEAVRAARMQATRLFGAEYLPAEPRVYAKKVKGAQEAHEAIRPAGDQCRPPEELRGELDDDQLRLYELIWKRTVASQMKDATGERTSVRLGAKLPDGRQVVFGATGRVLHFAGYLRAYVEGSDDPEAELEDKEKALPPLSEGDVLVARSAEAREHETQPPARFTEASLVRELEERGIGRPSTYASIIQTIQDRGYVFKKGTALVPTLTAFAVTNLMERHFGELVDYEFTARMEDDLDSISNGDRERAPWLDRFYFGATHQHEKGEKGPLGDLGLKAKIEGGTADIDPRDVCSLPLGSTPEGEVVAARVGRWGPYVQIEGTDRRANVPADLPPDELTLAAALELIAKGSVSGKKLGDGAGGEPIYLKNGRFGPYVQLGDAEAGKKSQKPRMASLWPGMTLDTLTLEQALLLLSYPKVLGRHPESGGEISAQDGQYGPYVSVEVGGKREYRSLGGHEALQRVTLDEALRLLAQPRERGRGAAGSSSLAELGTSPVTGKPVAIKKGRFGAYVTDGQVNATIPAGTDPSSLTLAQAFELIAAREEKLRERGEDPRAEKKPKAGARRAPKAASATKKSAAAGKVGKKAPAKKAKKATGKSSAEVRAKRAPAGAATPSLAPKPKPAKKASVTATRPA